MILKKENHVPADEKFTRGYYGIEFDDAAKDRMIHGCNAMHPILDRYRMRLTGTLVEFGPFRNPLLVPERFKNASILYVDGDRTIVEELRARYRADTKVAAAHMDLNHDQNLDVELRGWARMLGSDSGFQGALVSQVLNYIDYRKFFACLQKIMTNGGLVLINNVVDYGIPALFSERRPESNMQLIAHLKENGWKIIENHEFNSPFVEQVNSRLVLVIQKT